MKTKNKDAGFTMLELMVTMAMITIIMAFAIPNFITWRENFEFRSAVTEVLNSLQMAKVQAYKESSTMSISFNETVGTKQYDIVVFVDNGLDHQKVDAGTYTDTEKDADGDAHGHDFMYNNNERVVKKFNYADVGGNISLIQNDFPLNDKTPKRKTVGFRNNGTMKVPGDTTGTFDLVFENTKNPEIKTTIRVYPAGGIEVI